MTELPPSAPTDGPSDGPSEEEVRAYLDQMRQAPAEQVLAEVLQGLLNAAQIKLGRNDARLLLDSAAAVTDLTRPHLSGELASQVDQAIQQLRMAQVQAEKQAVAAGQQESNDLSSRPGPGASSAAGASAADASAAGTSAPGTAPREGVAAGQPGSHGQPGDPSPLNKLWIPGR